MHISQVCYILFRRTPVLVGICRRNQALCVALHFLIKLFFRRSKLRDVRVRPEPESPSDEELLVLPSRKSTLVRPSSAPNDTTRKVGVDFSSQL